MTLFNVLSSITPVVMQEINRQYYKLSPVFENDTVAYLYHPETQTYAAMRWSPIDPALNDSMGVRVAFATSLLKHAAAQLDDAIRNVQERPEPPANYYYNPNLFREQAAAQADDDVEFTSPE